jgi:hypothetical protein
VSVLGVRPTGPQIPNHMPLFYFTHLIDHTFSLHFIYGVKNHSNTGRYLCTKSYLMLCQCHANANANASANANETGRGKPPPLPSYLCHLVPACRDVSTPVPCPPPPASQCFFPPDLRFSAFFGFLSYAHANANATLMPMIARVFLTLQGGGEGPPPILFIPPCTYLFPQSGFFRVYQDYSLSGLPIFCLCLHFVFWPMPMPMPC